MSALPPVVVSGRAVHHADLHADLVDEDHHGVGAVDRGGELAQRLAHQPRLQAGQGVAHLAFELGARHQRRDRIDHQHVDRAGAHQRVGDLERLLAGIGLRDQQVVDIDARACGHRPGRARARRRRRRRCRPSSAPRRRNAARAWSCRRIPARRSRPPGRAAGRRCRARCRGRASRSRPSRYPSTSSFLPSRMIEPLPKLRSICESAASRAFDLSMEEPSTRRSAAAVAIAPTPYDRDSEDRQRSCRPR